MLDTSDEQWQEAFDVNVRAHVIAARLLVPKWLERGEGYFLSTASAAGLLSVIGSAPYAVTEHGAVAFAEWLSITYGDEGVRVSCLCPWACRRRLEGGLRPGARRCRRTSRHIAGPCSTPTRSPTPRAGLDAERFLILPHPEVQTMFQGKAADHDKWLGALRHIRASLAAQAAP